MRGAAPPKQGRSDTAEAAQGQTVRAAGRIMSALSNGCETVDAIAAAAQMDVWRPV